MYEILTMPWVKIRRNMSILVKLLKLVRNNDDSISRRIILNLPKSATHAQTPNERKGRTK
jgi:hypothetical protein